MLAFMAGPTMHIGHQVAYLLIFIMPYLLRYLFEATCLTDPVLRKMTYNVFVQGSPSMMVAAPREKNSIHPQAPPQEEEAKRVFDKRSDHQIKTTDLPLPNRGFRVQSWLSCERTTEGVAHLTLSKEAPILSPTNFHRSVKRNQPHKDRPI
jgi:hypothetical protein